MSVRCFEGRVTGDIAGFIDLANGRPVLGRAAAVAAIGAAARELHLPSRARRVRPSPSSPNPINPATLASGNYLDVGEPVVMLSDSSTGKTYLLIGLAACKLGRVWVPLGWPASASLTGTKDRRNTKRAGYIEGACVGHDRTTEQLELDVAVGAGLQLEVLRLRRWFELQLEPQRGSYGATASPLKAIRS